jgi:hypothetical protein
MQVHFYIPDTCNLELVQRDAFRDMGLKQRNRRHTFKYSLNIQPNDTPETIRTRMGEENILKHDPLDLEVLLEKWCTQENKLGHELYYYFV